MGLTPVIPRSATTCCAGGDAIYHDVILGAHGSPEGESVRRGREYVIVRFTRVAWRSFARAGQDMPADTWRQKAVNRRINSYRRICDRIGGRRHRHDYRPGADVPTKVVDQAAGRTEIRGEDRCRAFRDRVEPLKDHVARERLAAERIDMVTAWKPSNCENLPALLRWARSAVRKLLPGTPLAIQGP